MILVDTDHATHLKYPESEPGRRLIDRLSDATVMTALETLLNVLPPPALASKGKADSGLSGAASDFQALEKLRRLAFAESVPAPQVQLELAFAGESQQMLGLGDDEEANERDYNE